MTSNARQGNRILGSLRSVDGKGIVCVEDRFDADLDDLWSALTDSRSLARWLGEVEGDLRLGGAEQLAAYGAGVQVHVEDLAAYLAGHERCDADERWAELYPAYQGLATNVI